MPNTSDVWTQPTVNKTLAPKPDSTGDVLMTTISDKQAHQQEDVNSLSYFIYGSIGCFCYGEIHHHHQKYATTTTTTTCSTHYELQANSQPSSPLSAIVNRLIDIKEDNSRVSCVRFLKTSLYPIAMVLTESGSFLIHDCVTSENLVHYKRSELINKFIEPIAPTDTAAEGEPRNKRAKYDVTQQISSFCWPSARHAFLGISLPKTKRNIVVWLKLKEFCDTRENSQQSINKNDFIESHEQLELELPQYATPICCMDSTLLDSHTCLIAIATDDGLITIVNVNLTQSQSSRVIKLARHNDQVCSMSFYVGNNKKFPLGLLASASRNGLVLIWDIENEFYFADHQANASEPSRSNSKINWFALCFISSKESRNINLAVSNCDSGLTILDVPENTRSKIRFKENKDNKQQKNKHGGGSFADTQALRHHALIFNVSFDPITQTIMTSSLDANHILWTCRQQEQFNKNGQKEGIRLDATPRYLIPSMTNNSRTHMLRHSPIKEDLLGMALGKAGLRFYKISENPMHRRFDMNSSCSLIARKVTKASLSPTSIAWHPSHEYRIAIGTLEGKVLRADLTPRKGTLIEADHRKIVRSRLEQDSRTSLSASQADDIFDVEYNPMNRSSEHNGNESDEEASSGQNYKTDGVYSLCWGPNPTSPHDVSRLSIYAIGSITHRLFIYHNKKDNNDKLTNYLDECFDESIPEAFGEASEVAWKSSMDLMALGTTTGKIIIATCVEESERGTSDNLFRKLAVIQGPFSSSYIQCLAWHPSTVKDDSYYYCIAASSNESAAYVFNIKENLLASDVENKLKIEEGRTDYSINNAHSNSTKNFPSTITTFVSKLDEHKKSISDIAWNPHNPDILATSSFDRFCYVWSLGNSYSSMTTTDINEEAKTRVNASIVSKFSARDRLFTIEWSLVDCDLIFTSGHESTIWAWRPSENPYKSSSSQL